MQAWFDALNLWILSGTRGNRRLALYELTALVEDPAGLPGVWTPGDIAKAQWSRGSWYRLAGGTLPAASSDLDVAAMSPEEITKAVDARFRLVAAAMALTAHPIRNPGSAREDEARKRAYAAMVRRTLEAQVARRGLHGVRAKAIQGTELVELDQWMRERRAPDPRAEHDAEDALWASILTLSQRRNDVRNLGAKVRSLKGLVRRCRAAAKEAPGVRVEGDCGVVVAGLRTRRAWLFADHTEGRRRPPLSNDTVDVLADALQNTANGLVTMWNIRDGVLGEVQIPDAMPTVNDGDILTAMRMLIDSLCSAAPLQRDPATTGRTTEATEPGPDGSPVL